MLVKIRYSNGAHLEENKFTEEICVESKRIQYFTTIGKTESKFISCDINYNCINYSISLTNNCDNVIERIIKLLQKMKRKSDQKYILDQNYINITIKAKSMNKNLYITPELIEDYLPELKKLIREILPIKIPVPLFLDFFPI